jgi:predicted AAA+ superfamily ATPase
MVLRACPIAAAPARRGRATLVPHLVDAPRLPVTGLPLGLENTLHRMNPWWRNEPSAPLPTHRRHLVAQIQRKLKERLAPIIVVRGARQIGKTTAQLQLLADMLAEGIAPQRLFRVQFDELPEIENVQRFGSPVLRLVEWFEREILGKSLNRAATDGEPTYLFFDEVQNLSDWAPQLKMLVDTSATQVVVTGSSALRIAQGRDSLAGRITMLEAGVLSLTEIAAIRGLGRVAPMLEDNGVARLVQPGFWRDLVEHGRVHKGVRDQAFRYFSERGGYPLCHANPNVGWPAIAEQLNETVVRRVILHDLRVGERGRKRDATLLEELFRAVCRYAGQSPSMKKLLDELRHGLGANVGDNRVRAYLRFLSEALLVRTIQPLEIRLKRRRGHPKLCLVDHALRASWLAETVPLDPPALDQKPDLSTIAGHLAESIVGATLSTITGLDLAHVPAAKGRDEVDFVLVIGEHRVPIEVKYQAKVDAHRDTLGLRAFMDQKLNRASFGVLIARGDELPELPPDIVGLSLASLMLLR